MTLKPGNNDTKKEYNYNAKISHIINNYLLPAIWEYREYLKDTLINTPELDYIKRNNILINICTLQTASNKILSMQRQLQKLTKHKPLKADQKLFNILLLEQWIYKSYQKYVHNILAANDLKNELDNLISFENSIINYFSKSYTRGDLDHLTWVLGFITDCPYNVANHLNFNDILLLAPPKTKENK